MHEKKKVDGDGFFFEVGLHDIFKPLTIPSRNIKTYRYSTRSKAISL
jgi:hypothetical protein